MIIFIINIIGRLIERKIVERIKRIVCNCLSSINEEKNVQGKQSQRESCPHVVPL